MTVEMLVETLLDANGTVCVKRIIKEASVHLPRRGRRWIATYRDGSGRQFWKSTGLTDRRAALIVADQWEKSARRARAAHVHLTGEQGRRGGGKSGPGLTQREVALVLRISERAVRDIERRAIAKLRRHPALRALWRGWDTGDIGEAVGSARGQELSDAEIDAVYGLAQTQDEQWVLELMALFARGSARLLLVTVSQ